MNLANVVSESIAAMEESGEIRKKIDKRLNEAVDDIVKDLFGYRSPIKTALEERIKQAMQFDPTLIELPNYQALIGEQARAAFCRAMESAGVNQTEEVVSRIVGSVETGDLKFSTLVDLLKKSEWIADDDEGHEVTVIAEEPEYSSRWVYMDFNEGKDKYSCRFRLLVGKDGRISSIKIDGADRHISRTSLELGYASELETVLVNAYVTKRPLIFDKPVDHLDLEVIGEEAAARRGD